jgi:Alginate export
MNLLFRPIGAWREKVFMKSSRQILGFPGLCGGVTSTLLLGIATISVAASAAAAQEDPLQHANQLLKRDTKDKVFCTFEERTRWEQKFGVNFGKSINQQDMLSRLRIGCGVAPASWLTVYAMGQDARVPFYGPLAPNTMRDPMALQEAYIKLFDQTETGFGATFGRSMLDYGESRVIGTPQWTNVSRSYDQGRMYYRLPKARFEVLMVSPVKLLPGDFNTPDLGERIWGTYDVFTHLWHGASVDAYALRHSQNKIGGWTGAGTLGTDSFGGRLYGPLPAGLAYSFEGIGQTGQMGLLTQRAYAWFAGVSQKMAPFNKTLTSSAEYKVASGTKLGATNSATYDQLAPANHDKFGQLDLFGWRNLKTFKTLESLGITKALAFNEMYSNDWLFSAADSLYNSQGSSIAISKKGTAGTHVGQELDSFMTYAWRNHTFGAGVGYFFDGQFVENATLHINPRYMYLFQQYSFK